MNIVEGLSKFFGTEPFWYYLFAYAPAIFTVMFPAFILSVWTHLQTMKSKRKPAYLAYYNIFYILVFSAIPHKELRFLLPIVPFAFIMIAELLTQSMKRGSIIARLSVKIFVVVEILVAGVLMNFHQRDWEVANYLTRVKGSPVHSIYIQDRYKAAHYSWFHEMDTKIDLVNYNPMFARVKVNDPLPASAGHRKMLCNQIVSDIVAGLVLPEYVFLNEEDEDLVSFRLCEHAILSLERDGKKLYRLEKKFGGDIVVYDQRIQGPRQREIGLYHL